MTKDRDSDQVVYLALAAVLLCLAAFFVLRGQIGENAGMAVTKASPNTTTGMIQEVNTTVDDGGEADILQLKNQAKGL